MAGSLATGLLAAVVLLLGPWVDADEDSLTGAVLLGFALGWALLVAGSTWLTDRPQRWATAPAIVMGAAGVVLLAGSETVAHGVLDRVWPPVLLAVVIWGFVRARRRLDAPAQRWLVYPVLAALVVAGVGGGYETVQESADAATYAMPGQLVDVGGRGLHLFCQGSGTPTVVLEPGLGEMSSVFGWIAPAVARDTRVCVYDRAGRGWSGPSSQPQDGEQIAADLHALLSRGHVPGPYVLAGHSFGGLYSLTYAARYPAEVAGLVLLDSTAPASKSAPSSTDGAINRVFAVAPVLARVGAARLFGLSGYAGLPPQSRDEVRASAATPRLVHSTLDELQQSPASIAEAAALTGFGDKPLIVVTAGRGHDAVWNAAQDELATLSTHSEHRVVPGATHASLLEDEEDAAAVGRAIQDVVAAARIS